MTNIKHSSKSFDWHTPPDIIERARAVLGEIDFDPASSVEANKRVQAKTFFTHEQDALTMPWPDARTIFMNPPGGRIAGHRSAFIAFWERLLAWRVTYEAEAAIVIGFSIEALQTTQQCERSLGEFTHCIPRERIRFLRPDGTPGPSPSHANVIALLTGFCIQPQVEYEHDERFYQAFKDLGHVTIP